MRQLLVEKNSYHDSVFLMLISREVKKIPGIRDAVVSMGTEINLKLLEQSGYTTSDPQISPAITPNDLVIALSAENSSAADNAVRSVRELLASKRGGSGQEEGEYSPVSLESALKMVPECNLIVISVPGEYAAREARKALEQDIHVMLFSDNVSLQEEIGLKELALERGLLMMGPDCGTAIINGKPLCFANSVRRGRIGLAAASGTGLQEVTCIIDRLGAGVSQALGTGGRDLSPAVGGLMMSFIIEALQNDAGTDVIVVISKPPDQKIADEIISRLSQSGKPAVVHFIGLAEDPSGRPPDTGYPTLNFAHSLEEAAVMAAALAAGRSCLPGTFGFSAEDISRMAEVELGGMASPQRYIRGLFTGGTLADEALFLINSRIKKKRKKDSSGHAIEGVFSNNQTEPSLVLRDPRYSRKHTIIDMGADLFTVGKPHPMIDPSTRAERILREADDPTVAVLLLDLVLGAGSHPDPAGAISESLRIAGEKTAKRGGRLSIVTSLTGTEADEQDIHEQRKKLESVGCLVMPSNYQASLLALEIIRHIGKRKGNAK